ncbi:MAG: hypothetical protein GY940_20685 [bacterium]|nr:hypothetical protein [bacterium]
MTSVIEKNMAPCFSCGAPVPEIEGPVHRYMDSSPGCWKIFGEVLAREYSNAAYARYHRLTVDAYAAAGFRYGYRARCMAKDGCSGSFARRPGVG